MGVRPAGQWRGLVIPGPRTNTSAARQRWGGGACRTGGRRRSATGAGRAIVPTGRPHVFAVRASTSLPVRATVAHCDDDAGSEWHSHAPTATTVINAVISSLGSGRGVLVATTLSSTVSGGCHNEWPARCESTLSEYVGSSGWRRPRRGHRCPGPNPKRAIRLPGWWGWSDAERFGESAPADN